MSAPCCRVRVARVASVLALAVVLALLTVSSGSASMRRTRSNRVSSSVSVVEHGEVGKPVKVGVLLLSQAVLLKRMARAFETRLRHNLAPRRLTFKVLNADGQDNRIEPLARRLSGSDDDLFAAVGTPGIIALYRLERRRPVASRRPIIALAMTDPVKAGVARSVRASGTEVTGSVGLTPPSAVLARVMRAKPTPTRIGTIFDPSNDASKIWVAELKAALKSYPGVPLIEARISGPHDIRTAARSLIGRTNTWIMPPDTTVVAELGVVGSLALAAKMPLYITAGDPRTTGVLASIAPNWVRDAARAAGPAAAVLNGNKPGRIAFVGPGNAIVSANQKTAAALHASVPR